VLRIGILGAARIAPMAVIRPARQLAGVEIAAVAARDPRRARAFAARQGIARVHESYADLLADPQLDAIYNPLPNSHHCEWSIRALQAGKHVLCEKPFAANADEAQQMADAASASGKRLMEAFHWRYHPLAERMRSILEAGEIGRVEHVEASLCIPLWIPGDIRFRLDLAGGATMDTGCYAISMVRFLGAGEPEVVAARARLLSPGVDRCMEADLRFPNGATGRIRCSLLSPSVLRTSATVRGTRGELRVFNPFAPHLWHRLTVRNDVSVRHERMIDRRATYTHQLAAFASAVESGTPVPTGPEDAIANMRVIDAVYQAAGLPRRGEA